MSWSDQVADRWRPRALGQSLRTGAARVFAAAIVVSGCAVPAIASGSAAPSSRAPRGCPALAPKLVFPTPVDNAPVLSGGVVAVRLCRYGSLPAKKLRGQHLTHDDVLISSLVKQLNALVPVPTGVTACPVDDGSEVLLRGRYHNAGSADVIVGGGCSVAMRGRVIRSVEFSPGGPALLVHLVRLTR